MSRLKGTPKTGGRKKGTLNKSKQTVEDICQLMGYDPIRALIKIAQTSNDVAVQASCAKEVAKYVYPVKKAVEVSGLNGEPIKNESSFSPESKQILDELKNTLDNLASERRQQS